MVNQRCDFCQMVKPEFMYTRQQHLHIFRVCAGCVREANTAFAKTKDYFDPGPRKPLSK